MEFEKIHPFLPERIDINAAIGTAANLNLWTEKGKKVKAQDVLPDWLAKPKANKDRDSVDGKALLSFAKGLSKKNAAAEARLPKSKLVRKRRKGE